MSMRSRIYGADASIFRLSWQFSRNTYFFSYLTKVNFQLYQPLQSNVTKNLSCELGLAA